MTNTERCDLFQHGPLYIQRFDLVQRLKELGLRSGDILYRYSDAKGPLGLPFTRLVCHVTKSPYSHAALLFIENGEPFVFEVNDQGTLQYRLIDWLDTCYEEHFSIYRLKDLRPDQEVALLGEIHRSLALDVDYDFTFSDPHKFYCTESVMTVYRNALGIELDPGSYLHELMPFWPYWILRLGSFLFSFLGTALPFDQKMYFVGNEQRGMMSSPATTLIYKL